MYISKKSYCLFSYSLYVSIKIIGTRSVLRNARYRHRMPWQVKTENSTHTHIYTYVTTVVTCFAPLCVKHRLTVEGTINKFYNKITVFAGRLVDCNSFWVTSVFLEFIIGNLFIQNYAFPCTRGTLIPEANVLVK